ncbi:Na+/H+ antiporter NhaA [Colwellia sp. 12G3]|uniref:Na+/H+ antiporter NhaA n=1 Tax=Colwellia sp. 12G3 TaxID=2058299 RepID=UPI000C329080|nr:Na+/H+ antiporter NhaA [Colwellia sp. 12G3]PKI18194.1 Na+/H+ antiporter NhaA [Colwellia sp. 12G3]
MVEDSKNLLQRGVESVHIPFSGFIHAQTTASWFLLLATIVALWWANSDDYATYQNLTHTSFGFFLGDFKLHTSVKHIVNDGFMVIFFFLLGLEIKRELLVGDLSLPENRRMLILCAIGGMLCPAVIYSLFNWSYDSLIGWGIPMATDTAFALGVLTIVRKHIPSSLLAFLVGLAIVDDIGAILVIAIFYTQDISIVHLLSAFALIAFLALGNYAGVRQPYFYVVIGIATWWMMLKSGVHPTFSGVVIALTIPARPKLTSEKLLVKAKKIINSMQEKSRAVDVLGSRKDHKQVREVRDLAGNAGTPLRRWEDALALPVALFILPLFVLINAGVPFSLTSFIESLQHPTGLGIIMGLVLGKFIGISGACWLGLRYNIGCLPKGVSLQHVIGVSLIAGIGFTMSIFIATLGFDSQPVHLQNAKSAILVASLISAIIGLLYIRFVAAKKHNTSLNLKPKSSAN